MRPAKEIGSEVGRTAGDSFINTDRLGVAHGGSMAIKHTLAVVTAMRMPARVRGNWNWNGRMRNCAGRRDTNAGFCKRPEDVKIWRMYKYISLRRKWWNVEILCQVLRVSESGYYCSLRKPGKTKRRKCRLVRIKEIIGQYEDNDNYGTRRIHLVLLQKGETVSYSIAYRIMKQNGLLKKIKRHSNGITCEDAEAQKEYVMIYYNRQRIHMSNPVGWPSTVYREMRQRITA